MDIELARDLYEWLKPVEDTNDKYAEMVRRLEAEIGREAALDQDVDAVMVSIRTVTVVDASDELAEMVHDQASALANEANNGSMEDKIRFLLENGWKPDQIVTRVKTG